MTSPLSRKESREHLNNRRFEAYKKASGYVKHMKKSYQHKNPLKQFDKSEILLRHFQTSTPDNSAIKASSMPKSYLSSNIKIKIDLVNAYHNLSDIKAKSGRVKSREEKREKKGSSRMFTPKKYNRSLSRLLVCTQRPTGTPDVFLTTQTSLSKTKEKIEHNFSSIKKFKNIRRVFPLKDLIRLQKKISLKNSQLELCDEERLKSSDEYLISKSKPLSFREISNKKSCSFLCPSKS